MLLYLRLSMLIKTGCISNISYSLIDQVYLANLKWLPGQLFGQSSLSNGKVDVKIRTTGYKILFRTDSNSGGVNIRTRKESGAKIKTNSHH